jgi:hypothetical protein
VRGSARASAKKQEKVKMKKQLWWVLALFLCVGLGVVGYRSPGGAADTRQADAAYRDGSFQAKIDIANGRKPHLASGRWSSDQDRASFIAGYQQTYRQLADSRAIKPAEPTAAELAGFRDGLLDGARHRKAAQPFQVNKTDNFRNVGYAEVAAYRGAYSNGYQQGYYILADGSDLKTISQTSSPF